MIFILLLHVTDVFAMLVERRTTTETFKEATFDSYEGEPVFGDPQHKQYEVADFWWDKPTKKWEPWWDKMNMTVTKWYLEQSPSTDDLSEIWKEGMIDIQTSIKDAQKKRQSKQTTAEAFSIYTSTTTKTKPVLYKTTENFTTRRPGPIFVISSEEIMNPKRDPSPQSPLRTTTHDYLLDLLTAKSLNLAQQSAADLIGLREGSETTTSMSHPRKSDDAVPFDDELYRQLRGEMPPSLQSKPDLKQSPVFVKTNHKKAVKKVDKKVKASEKKPQGLHGWRLQYPGQTTRRVIENKTSNDIPVLNDFIEIFPRETISPPEKQSNHKKTPNSFEKLMGRSLTRSKLATLYKTSLKDADYYNIINDGQFIPLVKSDRNNPIRTFEIDGKFQHSGEPAMKANAEPNQYGYVENQPPQQIQTLRPLKDPYDAGLSATVSTSYSSTVHTIPRFAFDKMSIRQEDKSPFSPNVQSIALTPTAKIPGNFHADQLEVNDLRQPDLSGQPSQGSAAGHIREGSIEDIHHNFASAITEAPDTEIVASAITEAPDTQSVPSAITEAPDTQSVASAITEEPVKTISLEITVKSEKPDIMPAVAAVSPTFTVPNMETTVITTQPTTTAETTKFTLEMPPMPIPNNLLNYDIDWDTFNQGKSTTPLQSLLYSITIPEEMLTTVHPMVVEMRTEMVEQMVGYFTVFMRKVLDIASRKDEEALYALITAGSRSLDRINEYDVLRGLGRPMWPGLKNTLTFMALLPLDTLKSYAKLGYMSYKSGQMLHDDPKLRSLDYKVNNIYQVREGENLIKTLVAFEHFPDENGQINADQVTEDMYRALLAPWFRSKNSAAMYEVLYELNDKFTDLEKNIGGGGGRSNRRNIDTNITINDGLENEKTYVLKNKRTEDDSYYDESEKTIDKFRNNRVIDNIVKHENVINNIGSKSDKLRYNTKNKGTEASRHYIYVHDGETAVQKPPKKIQKSYKDSKKTTKNTKHIHYKPSKDLNTINKKEIRENKLYANSFKNVNTDLGVINIKNSKIANFNKDKLKSSVNYGGSFKDDRIIVNNKETRSISHDKKKTTSRFFFKNDRPTKPKSDYDAYYYDKPSKIIDKTVNKMTVSLKSESSEKNHKDYDTYDDSSKADSIEIKSPGKTETKSTNNNKIKTTSKNYDLKDRTTTKINGYDSYDDVMESKSIFKKVFGKSVSTNPPVQSNPKYKKVKNLEDQNALRNENIENSNFEYPSSFEVELKNKYQEIHSLKKNLEKLIEMKPDSLIDIKNIEKKVKHFENHGNGKPKLSEIVLQKRLETKQNPDDTKHNAKNNKIWQNNVSSVASFTKTKNHEHRNILAKENISVDVQKNSHKPVKTENKEKFWPHSKSRYIINDAAPSLKERFLDFNRDSIQSKNKNILRNLDKNKNILRDESSYSDDEELLKSNLQDNLLHGGRKFTDTLPKHKKSNVIRDISSYSDEEDTLKKNIYKTFT